MLSIRSNLSGDVLNIALEGIIDIKTSSDLEAEINSKIDRVKVDAFVGTAPQFDDLTMLSLKYYGAKS